MKRTLLAVALLAAVGAAQAAAVEKMQRFLDTTRTLRAEFTQTVVGKSGKAPQTSSGTMLISRPGKFAWLIDKPYKQQLVGDGEKVWMYDPDLRQVTVRKFDAALGSTPAALLVGAPDGSRQRLSCLGLRVGSTFSLLSRTAGGGRVAMVSGSRIALGSSLIKELRAEVVA